MVWPFASATEAKKDPNEIPQPVVKQQTEFHQIYHDFVSDVGQFRDKYPLTLLISMVVFPMLGINMLFSFSISGLVASVFFLGMEAAFILTALKEPTKTWEGMWNAIVEMKNVFAKMQPETPASDDDKGKEVDEKKKAFAVL